MATTPNINLYVVDPADNNTPVLEWVQRMGGVGSNEKPSNMELVDACVGDLRSCYEELLSGIDSLDVRKADKATVAADAPQDGAGAKGDEWDQILGGDDIKNVRKWRMNEEGEYEILHYETKSNQVLMENGQTVEDAIASKQSTLTFDETPTPSSDNMVTSGAVYDAIHRPYFFTATLLGGPENWSYADGYYSQTIEIAGLRQTDCPDLDIYMGDSNLSLLEQYEADFYEIKFLKTADNSATVYVKNVTEHDVPIKLTGVR